MEPKDAIKAFWQNAFRFNGRASRSEFWWGIFPPAIVGFIFSLVMRDAQAELQHLVDFGSGPISQLRDQLGYTQNLILYGTVLSIVIAVPTLSCTVRRLHDRNTVGWWAAIIYMPAINLIWALIVLTREGTKGPNRFGPDPLERGGHDLDPDNKLGHQTTPSNAATPLPQIPAVAPAPEPTLSKLKSPAPNSSAMRANSIDPADEDAFYEQAFKELEDGERVVAAWSRAFAEAVGDEQKAKALYIQSRVLTLKQKLLDDREEAERVIEDGKQKTIEEATQEQWYEALRKLPECTDANALRISRKIIAGKRLADYEKIFRNQVKM
jgi:uncharacterized membrane protein YhaH (DUF805 family)